MIQFLISFLMTVITSFFVTSVIFQKNFIKIFITYVLVMFALIVLNIEILSLFSLISETGILVLNILFTLICGYIWFKKGKPIFVIKPSRFLKKLYYAIITDRYLAVIGLAFLFMCFVSICLAILLPVVNPDAEAYHVVRSLFWISNGNLNHFSIADARAVTMPINSELLYLWNIIFLKKQLFFGLYSFTGFLLGIVALYGILQKIGFGERHKLWTIFILSSLPSVIVQISGTETDIIIAGLVLASIYMYWSGLKSETSSKEIFIAALAYALAIGTKTPSLMLMFPIGVWMIWLGSKYNSVKLSCKIFAKFLGFGAINFILFASYNYILNLIDFGNLFGSVNFLNVHRNLYGIKGTVAGFIKHIFLFFDFTGFRWNQLVGPYILKFKSEILYFLNLYTIPDGKLTGASTELNRTLIESSMGMGILGFTVYLPCWLYSLIKPLFCKDKKTILTGTFGIILLCTVIIMSCQIVYMSYSIRFLTCFCFVCAPVLAYSYFRKNSIFKFFISCFILFGLLLVSTHLWARPFGRIVHYYKNGYSIHQLRDIAKCSIFHLPIPKNKIIINDMCIIRDEVRQIPKDNNILYFSNVAENILEIKQLQFEGYKIDFELMQNADKIDFDKYDIIITTSGKQLSTYILDTKNILNNSPTEGIDCTYISTDDKIYNIADNKLLYASYCKFDKNFTKLHNFEKYTYKNIKILRAIQYNDSINYYFYRKQKP